MEMEEILMKNFHFTVSEEQYYSFVIQAETKEEAEKEFWHNGSKYLIINNITDDSSVNDVEIQEEE